MPAAHCSDVLRCVIQRRVANFIRDHQGTLSTCGPRYQSINLLWPIDLPHTFNMPLRCAARSSGLCTRPLANLSTPTAAPRFLKVAFYPSLQPLRLYSSDSEPSSSSKSLPSTLFPPWQICDLNKREREAYAEYGDDYIEHLRPHDKVRAIQNKVIRQELAQKYRDVIGSDWYSIMQEANQRSKTEVMKPKMDEFKRRAAWLRQANRLDGKSEEYLQLKAERRDWDQRSRLLRRSFEAKFYKEVVASRAAVALENAPIEHAS